MGLPDLSSLSNLGLFHIMVLCNTYYHPYAVHFITNRKLPFTTVLRKAHEILSKHFPNWKEKCVLDYLGYEEIPIDEYELNIDITNMNEIYYVAVEVDKEKGVVTNYFSTVPKKIAEIIERYRQKYITVDYDLKHDYYKGRIHDTINYLIKNKLVRDVDDVKIYETEHGYHIRAKLFDELPLNKILDIRDELEDDSKRKKIDKIYLKSNLGFLTNALFNEKYYAGAKSRLEKSVEKEIDLRKIVIVHSSPLRHKDVIDHLEVTTNKGVIELKDDRIIFKGWFGNLEMKDIRDKVEEKLREFRKQQGAVDEEELRKKVIEAYKKISPRLGVLVSHCDIKYVDGYVVIRAPEHLQNYIGLLIGQHGKNIKAVENEIGMKIVIEGTTVRTPPQKIVEKREERKILLKKSLREMLKQMVGG